MFVGSEKMTMDAGPEVCFQLGREDTMRFYTWPGVLVGGVNSLTAKSVLAGEKLIAM